ncbi:hypothetical protein [Nonomuraea sp. NPDC003754]
MPVESRRPATWRAITAELTDTQRRKVEAARMRAAARRNRKD